MCITEGWTNSIMKILRHHNNNAYYSGVEQYGNPTLKKHNLQKISAQRSKLMKVTLNSY